MLSGYLDRSDLGLAFRRVNPIDDAHGNCTHQRRLVQEHCGSLGWKVPTMLAHLNEDDDFYFDRIDEIRMPGWSAGRIALVGDAGYSVSPLAGMGGSMAIIGAARLGEALGRHGGDYTAGLRSYEEGLRPFVEEIQEWSASHAMATMLPASEAESEARNRRLVAAATSD